MLVREIHGKRFITRENIYRRSDAKTVFEYFIGEADTIYGTYTGGQIRIGQLAGKITQGDKIEMLFQCVTATNELLSGCSTGRVSRGDDGLLHLDFEWNWLSGDKRGGTSS